MWDLDYRWRDSAWRESRAKAQAAGAPISIYEVHLGSWRRVPGDSNRPLTYREAAGSLELHELQLFCVGVLGELRDAAAEVHGVPFALENHAQGAADILFVIHDQDAFGCHG